MYTCTGSCTLVADKTHIRKQILEVPEMPTTSAILVGHCGYFSSRFRWIRGAPRYLQLKLVHSTLSTDERGHMKVTFRFKYD